MKKTSQQNKPPTTESIAAQQTHAMLMQEAAKADARAGAGIEAAFEKADRKARKIHKTLVRLAEMLRQDEKAHLAESVDSFLLRLRDGDGGEPLVFDALLLGAELGADTDTQKMLQEIRDTMKQMQPHVAGVPAVVEQANENKREAMGDLYRTIYAPGFTPKQKAIADAMRETNNTVRQTTPILKSWGWKGVSPGRVSIELGKMDKLFADAKVTNPFASRKDNRKRPVVETTYSKRKVDPDDPDSAVEIVPNRPGGYSRGET